ncbi:azurin [Catalinimonas alkaloidigena]|uniref:plastocyanin/azurin family copper-binding protein n=1 Tax=Catalinimonas alkaloidigena TaxID=1075417 RepID=UPI002404CA51|nr:plastocyanin/azurin family copper-binding protein [Catalinimonas alkaloidigena]MDF9796085.1 azurin [Catalinimonas alkaloidigena]
MQSLRNYFFLSFLFLGGGAILSSFFLQQAPEQAKREIIIKAISGLQYDTVRFKMSPGETIKITLINTDEMAHNMVITKPGKREEIVDMALKMGSEAEAKNFIPDAEWILASAPVLKPEEKFSFTFTAPDSEGVYPYVCTYPGHGAIMYGAIYVTSNMMPPLANDENIPPQRRGNTDDNQANKAVHPYPNTFPRMYRAFLPDTGPASIAVGMTNKLSYCWDAGTCRFRYLWKGGFVDMTRAWSGKGKERADIVGTVFYREENEAPFRLGSKDNIPAPEFLGYRMENKYPTFSYRLDGVEVSERITPTLEKPGMKRVMQFKNLKAPIWFVRPKQQGVDIYVNKGKWEGDYLKLSPEEAKEFTIIVTEKKPEI